MAPRRKSKESEPKWSDVKKELTALEPKQLIDLLRELYRASRDNRDFLHARFAVAGDLLAPYKKTITRWISPEVHQLDGGRSISRARKALSDYRKARGDDRGLAELCIHYVASGGSFLGWCGMDDEGCNDSMVSVFDQACRHIFRLEGEEREDCIDRLQDAQNLFLSVGYGAWDSLQETLDGYFEPEEA